MSEAADEAVRTDSGDVEKKKSPEVVKAKPTPRSIEDIESDMAATRERLSSTLDDLKVAAQPKTIANRQMEKVKDFYTDDYGAVRADRVAATVAVVVGLIVVRRTWRRITR